MSQASRKRQAERLEKAKAERFRFLGGMLRPSKRVLTYSLVGALALGSWLAYERLPSLLGMKPHYSLELVFLNHGNTNSAESFVEEIDTAERAGRPFNIMFAENAGQRDTDYMEAVLSMNKKFSIIRGNYLLLLKKGYSEKEAEAKVRTMTHIRTGDTAEETFLQYVFTAAGAHGLKILPLESITGSNIKRYNDVYNHNRAIRKDVEKRISANRTLEEVAQGELALEEDFLKLNDSRNIQVVAGLPERFSQALSAFPELRSETAKGKQLRAIGYMGYEHSPFFYNQKQSNGKIDLKLERVKDSQHPILERIVDTMATPRQFTRREALLIALEELYVGRAVEYLSENGHSELARKLTDNSLALSERQLEKIDQESAAVKDPKERAAFVLNLVIGSQYFILPLHP